MSINNELKEIDNRIRQVEEILNTTRIMADFKAYFNSISKPNMLWTEKDRKIIVDFKLFLYRDYLIALKEDYVISLKEIRKLKRKLNNATRK